MRSWAWVAVVGTVVVVLAAVLALNHAPEVDSPVETLGKHDAVTREISVTPTVSLSASGSLSESASASVSNCLSSSPSPTLSLSTSAAPPSASSTSVLSSNSSLSSSPSPSTPPSSSKACEQQVCREWDRPSEMVRRQPPPAGSQLRLSKMNFFSGFLEPGRLPRPPITASLLDSARACNCSVWSMARRPPACREYLQAYVDAMSTGYFGEQAKFVSPYEAVAGLVDGVTRTSTSLCLRQKTIMFIGDSYTRELFFTLIELLTGEPPTPEFRKIPSGDKYFVRTEAMAALCDPDRTGLGNNGLDLINCGKPGNRTWKDRTAPDGVTLMFQFKTYSETPEMDVISEENVRQLKPDLLVIGTGQWGLPKPQAMRAFGIRHTQLVDQVGHFVGRMRSALEGPVIFLAPQVNSNITPTLRRAFDGNCSDPLHSGTLTWDRNEMTVCSASCPEAVMESARKHAWLGLIQHHMAKTFVSLLCQA